MLNITYYLFFLNPAIKQRENIGIRFRLFTIEMEHNRYHHVLFFKATSAYSDLSLLLHAYVSSNLKPVKKVLEGCMGFV